MVTGCEAPAPMPTRVGTVMGTVAELKVVPRGGADVEGAFDAAFAELEHIEGRTTSYRDSSDVSRLRRDGSAEVSEETDAVLALALDVSTASDGTFDPTAGALVQAWGFPDDPAVPDSAAIAAALATMGTTRVRRDGERHWTTEPGVALDLGGIAKGWAVDRVADLLQERAGACLVNVGGDLAVRGRKSDGSVWKVGVQDPRDPSKLFLTLALSGPAAVATSGDYQRYVEVDGVRYHHLLDPRTGWPARDVRSATVVAETCAEADAWATAVFILGPERGIRAMEDRPGLEGVIVTTSPDGELVLHETSGFSRLRAGAPGG
jgi:thiamine biosynthesis lipoprotein